MARVISRRAWCAAAAGLAVAVMFALSLGGGSAGAQTTPQVTAAGTINGSPIRVGTRLTATGGSLTGPTGTRRGGSGSPARPNARSWTSAYRGRCTRTATRSNPATSVATSS